MRDRDSVLRPTETTDGTTTTPTIRDSRVIKRLPPGTPGTRRLQQHYGSDLVCVRYRESPSGRTRYTTVEILIEQRPGHRDDFLRIGHQESKLRRAIIAAGGRWVPRLKAWRLAPQATRTLGLKHRIAKDLQH